MSRLKHTHTIIDGRIIGFVEHMPFDEYLDVDAMSGSELVHMRRSPLNYRFRKDNPQPATDAMKLGTTIHTAVLEPPLLGKIAIWGLKDDEKVRRGKVWDAFRAANAGMTILTRAEQAEVAGAVEGVWNHVPARKYLAAEGKCELSMFWVDPYDGRYWKGRLDKLVGDDLILDLKKTRSCSSHRFGSQAFGLGYHIKAAVYISGYQILTGTRARFKWLAIESSKPYECAVYRATPDVITLGGEEMLALLSRLKECESTGNWPPEQETESDLILPTYAYQNEDDFAELEYAQEGE